MSSCTRKWYMLWKITNIWKYVKVQSYTRDTVDQYYSWKSQPWINFVSFDVTDLYSNIPHCRTMMAYCNREVWTYILFYLLYYKLAIVVGQLKDRCYFPEEENWQWFTSFSHSESEQLPSINPDRRKCW